MRRFVIVSALTLIGYVNTSCVGVQTARIVSINQVAEMPPFDATIESVEISHPLFLYHCVDIWLRQIDTGRHLDLQICPANDFVLGFAHSLHPAQMYSFPQLFADYANGSSTNFINSTATGATETK